MLLMAGILHSPPAYLKMDVEGFEYDIFAQMIQKDQERRREETFQTQQQREEGHHNQGQGFRQIAWSSTGFASSMLPDQIQVELHWATRMTGVEWMPRTLSAGELALFDSMMYFQVSVVYKHLTCMRCFIGFLK